MDNNYILEISEMMKRRNKIAVIVIVVAVFFVLVSPFLFTRTTGIIDFSRTGEIGDTIGGITAPIIGLLSAILIYLSFKAQTEANIIQMMLLGQEKSKFESGLIDSLLFEMKRTEVNLDIKGSIERIHDSFYKIYSKVFLPNEKRLTMEEIEKEFKSKKKDIQKLKDQFHLMNIIANKIYSMESSDTFQKEHLRFRFIFIYDEFYSKLLDLISTTYSDELIKKELPEHIDDLIVNYCFLLKSNIEKIKTIERSI